jgi:N-methylhydantoinase B
MAALVGQWGLPAFRAACDALMDHAERLMRQAIARLPEGSWRAETRIDGFLDDPDPARRELPLVATVTKRGDGLVVDLTGTAPQVPDRPINMPLAGTVDVAVWLTVRSVLLDTAVHGHIPVNEGLTRPIEIVAPRGCLANPEFPAPTIARFAPGNQLADTVMKALAQAVPGQVSAGIGNLKVIAFSGLRGGSHWVHMEIFEGSYGGRPDADGMDAVDTLYANTRNNPIEDIESHFPLRVTQYELLEDRGGPGRWRGGLGTAREIEFLDDAGCSLEGDGSVWAPPGLFGGKEGTPGAVLLNRGSDSEIELPSKFPYRKAAAGDRLCLVSPCGGGYGDPLERDRERINEDLADGYVTAESARTHYGFKESE